MIDRGHQGLPFDMRATNASLCPGCPNPPDSEPFFAGLAHDHEIGGSEAIRRHILHVTGV